MSSSAGKRARAADRGVLKSRHEQAGFMIHEGCFSESARLSLGEGASLGDSNSRELCSSSFSLVLDAWFEAAQEVAAWADVP
eukprot:15485840-Alexandrium_andersonii.AAC.1